jgi:hypothetical protein
LERRDVMASNFTATLAAGNLTIIGSNDNDALYVTQQNGALVLSASGPINGGARSQRFNGVTNLSIALGGGTDSLGVVNVNLPGNLTIDTDFNAQNPGVPGNTAALDRADGISIGNVRVGGSLTTNTGGGNDSLTLAQVAIVGSATINTGAGNDTVYFGAVGVNGATTVNTNSGNDNLIVASSVFRGPFNANMGDGNDYVVLSTSRFLSTTTVNGGSGVNRKTISGNSFAVAPVFVTI